VRFQGLAIAALAAAAAVGGFFAWQTLGRPHVAVVAAQTGPAIRAVYATGIVEPVQWAKVTPLVRGRIEDICNCEGARVPAGAELARLDDSAERARLDELKARETFLAQETARYRALSEHGTASVQAYQQRSSELLQARAAISAQRELLDDYVLRAPMDGVVLRRDGEVGEIASPGDVLFWVGQLRPLWVVAEVDEEDIPLVAPEQNALLKADAFPDTELAGTVQQITPKGDPVNKSYRVRIALPEDSPLRIGMTVEANIVVQRIPETLLVPVSALRADTEGRFVFTAEDGRAVRRRVTAGVIGTGTDARAEILHGLAAGDPIVADPPGTLADGDRIDTSAP
jgi:RND family efflux transporter MFP subunit